MKQVAILGERQAGLVDVPDLEPKEDWAVVKIHAAPMCTEYHSFDSGSKSSGLGHEAAGRLSRLPSRGELKSAIEWWCSLSTRAESAICACRAIISTARMVITTKSLRVGKTGHRRWRNISSSRLGFFPKSRRCFVRTCLIGMLRFGTIVQCV